MTAALEGGEWSAVRLDRILPPPGKTRYPFFRRLGGPQRRSGRAENLVPIGIRSRTVQPVVSRYTDWATRPTNIFAEYNQQDAMFHNLFISARRSTCFRRFFRPSSGAQNCSYSVRYLSDRYLTLYMQFWAPDDGRKTRLKRVERLAEINKLWNAASCFLYSANNLVSLYSRAPFSDVSPSLYDTYIFS
jgi:hypothetical protein